MRPVVRITDPDWLDFLFRMNPANLQILFERHNLAKQQKIEQSVRPLYGS